MVVHFIVHLRPDWFVYSPALMPPLVCTDSKLFKAALAAWVTSGDIYWINLITVFAYRYFIYILPIKAVMTALLLRL